MEVEVDDADNDDGYGTTGNEYLSGLAGVHL